MARIRARGGATPRWVLLLFWWTTRRRIFKPIWRSELVADDLLQQAWFLHQAGYHVAAVMLARASIERGCKKLALLSPGGGDWNCRTACDFAQRLCQANVIDDKTRYCINRTYDQASKVAHDGEVQHGYATAILANAKCLSKKFNAAISEVMK